MVDRATKELDDLWNEFHAVVNLTSRELYDWHMTQSAGQATEEFPDQAGSELGRHVLSVLSKRRMDLTEDDKRVMRKVIDQVVYERGEDLEGTSDDAGWRHRLMTLGHDPLRPLRSEVGVTHIRQR